MSVKIKGNRGSGDFEPPPEGLWNAVCVDVVDEGMREVTWEGKTTSRHEVRITWMLECEMEDA